MPANAHNKQGNCIDDATAYSCPDCGKTELCDVCHLHSEPRGECSECPPCKGCEAAIRAELWSWCLLPEEVPDA